MHLGLWVLAPAGSVSVEVQRKVTIPERELGITRLSVLFKLFPDESTGLIIKLGMHRMTDRFLEFFAQVVKDYQPVYVSNQHITTYASEGAIQLGEAVLLQVLTVRF